MSHARCLVTFESHSVSFRWSDGARFFEPYHLSDALWDRFASCNAQAKAKLCDCESNPSSQSTAALARAGHELMESIFPNEREACAEIRNWLASFTETTALEIMTNRHGFVPWNVVYDQTPNDAAQWRVDEDAPEWHGFWGHRFELVAGCAVHAMRKIPALRTPDILLVVDPAALESLESAQRDRWQEFLTAHDVSFADSALSLKTEIEDLEPELIYFWGRADAGGFFFGSSHVSWRELDIILQRQENSDQIQLFPNWFYDDSQVHPLSAFQSSLFASANLLAGCEIPLSASTSFDMGLDVLDVLFDNDQPIGSAFHTMRSRHKLAGLCYGVYTPAQANVTWQEDADAGENEYELPDEPYRPLMPYERSDRPLLCERDSEVMTLCRLLDNEHTKTIVLHGSPGAGKTSLVRGGVLPFLEDDCLGYRFLYDRTDDDLDEDDALFLAIRATNDLASQLANAITAFCSEPYVFSTPTGRSVEVDLPAILQRHLHTKIDITAIQSQSVVEGVATTVAEADDGDDDDNDDAYSIWRNFRNDPAHLAQLLHDICSQLPFQLVVVIENLEEVFAGSANRAHTHQDLASLAELSVHNGSCKVIVTIASEFLGRLYDEIPPATFPQWKTMHLALPTRMQLLRTILLPTSKEAILHGNEIPFGKYNFQFEEDAPEHLLELAEDAAQIQHVDLLPVLQIACAYLYMTVKDRDDSVVRKSDLNRLGNLEHLLEQYIDTAIKQLGIQRSDRWMIPILIQDLTNFENNGSVLRRYEDYETLLASKWNDVDSFPTVVEQLSALEVGVFEQHTQYTSSGEIETLSLGRDSLPQLGGQLQAKERQRKYFRSRLIDVLWIAVPVVFLLIVITFVVTRRYAQRETKTDPELTAANFKKLIGMLNEFKKEYAQLAAEKQDLAYFTQIGKAKQAWDAGDVLTMRKKHLLPLIPNAQTADRRGFEWWYLWRLANSERHKLLGHIGYVTSVAISADDKWIATASVDGAIKLWDAKSGKILADFAELKTAVHQVAFSKNRQWLAAAAADKKIYLWKLDKIGADHQTIAKPAKTLAGHDARVLQIAFISDTDFVSTGADKAVMFWNIEKDQSQKTVKDHSKSVVALSVSPSGNLIATGDNGGTIYIRDRTKGETKSLTYSGTLTSLAFSPDEKKLAFGGSQERGERHVGSVFWVNLSAHKSYSPPIYHSSNVAALAFGANDILLTAGQDNRVRSWNLPSGEAAYDFKGHVGAVTTLAVSTTKRFVVTGSLDRTVKFWDRQNQAYDIVRHSPKNGVTDLAFFANGKLFASSGRDRSIKIWDAESATVVSEITDLPTIAGTLAVGSDKKGYRIAAAVGKAKQPGEIIVWQITNDKGTWSTKKLFVLKAHKAKIRSVAWSPDGKELASVGDDQNVVTWDLENQKPRVTKKLHQKPIVGVSFSEDSKQLCTTSIDGRTMFSDAATGDIIPTFRSRGTNKAIVQPYIDAGHTGDVRALALLPYNLGFATVGSDRTIRLHQWKSVVAKMKGEKAGGVRLKLFVQPKIGRGHSDDIVAVMAMPKSGLIVTAGLDGTVILWDPISLQIRFRFHSVAGPISALAVSQDEQIIAVGNEAGEIQMWKTGPQNLGVEHK